MKSETRELLWSAQQVATALGIGERTVWRLAAAGQIPPGIRFGGSTRWPADTLREWIADKQAEALKGHASRGKPT